MVGPWSARGTFRTPSNPSDLIAPWPVRPTGGTTTSGRPSTLAKDKLYYWRVRAISGELRGPWFSPARFRTPKTVSGGGSSGSGGGCGAADQINLSQVTWLDHNVSGWAKTSTITSTSIGNPPICIDHTKRGQWRAVNVSGTAVEKNPWVFANVNGRWYAATYEWVRPGQSCSRSRQVISVHTSRCHRYRTENPSRASRSA